MNASKNGKTDAAVSRPVLNFHVSPEGRDTWSGCKPQPDAAGRDGPFATPERARDAVRAIRLSGGLPPGGLAVSFHGGVYERSASFVLGPEDSGTPACPIVYRAHPGEDVRWSGGREIAGFRRVENPEILRRLDPAARGAVWQAELKSQGITSFGSLSPRGFGRPTQPAALELFFRDQPMTLARWPNRGFVSIASVPGPQGDWSAGGSKEGKFSYSGDRPKRWSRLDDVWLHGYWCYDWADTYEKVKTLDTAAREIHTVEPHGAYGYRSGQRFYFLNLLEELDEPGEWYLDRESGVLYFWPPGEIAGGRAVVSVLEQPLIVLENASHVAVEGLTLECGRGCGVRIQSGEENRIIGCTLRNFGNEAVVIRDGRRHAVAGCDITGTGDGGVRLSGGDRKTLEPGAHVVHNNHIHHFARWCRCYFTAVLAEGVGHRISNNLIHDAPHCAILFGGNEHLIEFNEIFSVCQETGDVGAIYTGRDYTWRGNVIRHNFIHHTGGVGMGSNAVYLDDCVSGHTLFGNIFYRTPRAAFIGGGRDTLVANNLFVECDPAVWVDGRGTDPHPVWQDMVYKTMKERLDAVNYRQPPYSTRYPRLADLNRYFEEKKGVPPEGNVIIRNVCIGGTWLKTGWRVTPEILDIRDNVVDADPRWVDAANGDFQLRAGSPAEKMGFQRIPVECIGLFRDESRRGRELVHSHLELVRTSPPDGGGRTASLMRLILRNVGDLPASGEMEMNVEPGGAASLSGCGRLSFSLRPGEATTHEMTLTGASGIFLLYAHAVAGTVRPSLVQAVIEWAVTRLGALKDPGEVAGALAPVAGRAVAFEDAILAELRFAVAGECLALHARVFDRQRVQSPKPWEGSCIELFGSIQESRAIGQVFLLPRTPQEPARALRQSGDRQVPAEGIRLETSDVPGGYEMRALVPLTLLAVTPACGRFLLEAAVSAAPCAERSFLRGTLFGSTSAYNNTSRYGRVVLTSGT
ncbi:MAG: right-handed parallel beta-helix repeat-containing protein [Planctomycetes bacterium]|nr:right-handed parallel beta-helix repeat-containing protein [Planctomycetota bacterium]